ncbi:hypothetical protein BG011_002085 [Mortierella polycephala]|uniref:CHY-type domain-containing protein n=1 Tax=Mortierella polycephala TaxID=41804 RepID=A0A9P6U5A7_9FUNG|nr:hypothetical protein BG011_002085 [Mortierella polycephala]
MTSAAPHIRQRAQERAPVPRPVPACLQNVSKDGTDNSLRAFEIAQVERRFGTSPAPASPTLDGDSVLGLHVVPSDPDFPYDVASLHVQLVVPKDYPRQPCSLKVLNKDIPVGFATNLERGFAGAALQNKSLLGHLNWLDVNMEQLLQKPPAPTMRFVGHSNQSHATGSSVDRSNVSSRHPPNHITKTVVQTSFTIQQLDEASVQRQKQLAQIQARFRSSFESISPTNIRIALVAADKSKMPVKWDGTLWVNLLVPKAFPLEPCTIRLKEDDNNPEIEQWRARNVEQGFSKIVASMPQLSLFQLLNQLNRDLKDLLSLPSQPLSVPPPLSTSSSSSPSSNDRMAALTSQLSSLSSPRLPSNHGSGHIQRRHNHVDEDHGLGKNPKLVYVDSPSNPKGQPLGRAGAQRTTTSGSEGEDEGKRNLGPNEEMQEVPAKLSEGETESEGHDDSSDNEEKDCQESVMIGGPAGETSPKRGIEIRMPDLKLEHISLLYCRSLSLLVRCNRCKGLFNMPDLLPDDGQHPTEDKRKWRTCDNCQSVLGAHYRSEYIHIQSRTIGYLDLAGCTPYDLLPSVFVPTCSECDQILGSTADTQSGDAGAAVETKDPQLTVRRALAPAGFRQRVGRGMSTTANCRKCHARMTFAMEGEIKFVKLSPGDLMKVSATTLEQLPLKKKPTRGNKSGLDFELKVGEALPRKGACDHYKKSRRWFRFPCCSKIYPCHACHDEKESDSHEFEYAKRMICGHCSREQTVSDKPCVCGESPFKTAGGSGSFWEGGEGTRDKVRMSTKDSRKHRGSNKTVAKKQVGEENIRKRAPKS